MWQSIAGAAVRTRIKDAWVVSFGWLALHVALLAVLLNHPDINPIVWGYSAPYAAFLVLVAVTGLFGAALFPARDNIRVPQGLAALRSNVLVRLVGLLIGTAAIVVIWTAPFQNIVLTQVQREAIRGWGTLVVLIVIYVGLFWRSATIVLPWSAWVVATATMGAMVVILAVHYLDRFPQLNLIDELHNWSVQWTYANTGLLGEAMYRQMIPLPQPLYPSPHYAIALMLRFFGDTIWQARFARMLLMMFALPFIYLSGKRMYGARAGLFAVVFALLLIVPVAFVRPDFFVGVMLSVAIYLYLWAQQTRRPWPHYLTGLCIALAGEGHALAYRFGLTFAVLYGLRWLYQMWTTRRLFLDGRFVALVLGGATGMLIYLAIHILPGLEQGLHFASNYAPLNRTIESQSAYASAMLQQQLDAWVSTSPLELIIVVFGVGLALIKFEDGDRLLLALLLVSEGLMLASYGYYRLYYQVHSLPIFALLAGRLVANLFDAKAAGRSRAGPCDRLALASMICVAAFLVLVGNAQAASSDPLRDDYTQIGKRLKADLPADKIVVGNEDYFLEIRSLNYYGIETVTTPSWFLVDYEGYRLWQVTNPDIFILSPQIDTPKYTDLKSIRSYIADNGFKLVRCYTGDQGLITAQVYALDSAGMEPDGSCAPD